MSYHLAIDIGASSGRHVLGRVENGRIMTKEVYRFENRILRKGESLYWDIETLMRHVLTGIKACGALDMRPATLGIDTWAVDYALLDENKALLGGVFCYRDSRTQGMDKEVERLLPFKELYARTGIQKQPFNTLYQLMADQCLYPERWRNARYFFNGSRVFELSFDRLYGQ